MDLAKNNYLKQFTVVTTARNTGHLWGLNPVHAHLALRLTSELDSDLACQILFV